MQASQAQHLLQFSAMINYYYCPGSSRANSTRRHEASVWEIWWGLFVSVCAVYILWRELCEAWKSTEHRKFWCKWYFVWQGCEDLWERGLRHGGCDDEKVGKGGWWIIMTAMWVIGLGMCGYKGVWVSASLGCECLVWKWRTASSYRRELKSLPKVWPLCFGWRHSGSRRRWLSPDQQ